MTVLSENKNRKITYSVCIIIFFAGIIISVRARPDLLDNLSYLPASLVFLIGAPATLLLNTTEYVLMGKTIGQDIKFKKSVEVTILASAANTLPIPGGLITRVASLKNERISYIDATKVNVTFGFIWLGMAFLSSGAGLVHYSRDLIGILLMSTGTLLIMAVCFYTIYRKKRLKYIFLTLLQRLVFIIVATLRIWGCLFILKIDANAIQSLVLTMGGAISSAISLAPAGLGIREGISAGIAPLVGLGSATVFLASALNRILGMIFLAITSLWLMNFQRIKTKQG